MRRVQRIRTAPARIRKDRSPSVGMDAQPIKEGSTWTAEVEVKVWSRSAGRAGGPYLSWWVQSGINGIKTRVCFRTPSSAVPCSQETAVPIGEVTESGILKSGPVVVDRRRRKVAKALFR